MTSPTNQDTPVAFIVPEALDELRKHPNASATVWGGNAKHRATPLYSSDQFDRMRERAERAEALLAEAEKVLEPFGTYGTADGLPGGAFRVPDSHPILFDDVEGTKPAVTIGHLRAARTLLTKLQDTSHASDQSA